MKKIKKKTEMKTEMRLKRWCLTAHRELNHAHGTSMRRRIQQAAREGNTEDTRVLQRHRRLLKYADDSKRSTSIEIGDMDRDTKLEAP